MPARQGQLARGLQGLLQNVLASRGSIRVSQVWIPGACSLTQCSTLLQGEDDAEATSLVQITNKKQFEKEVSSGKVSVVA